MAYIPKICTLKSQSVPILETRDYIRNDEEMIKYLRGKGYIVTKDQNDVLYNSHDFRLLVPKSCDRNIKIKFELEINST